ncbi:mobilization protein [Porphyromonas gingivalis]|nr:mobilization protein [Porphyromonas gingivalis]
MIAKIIKGADFGGVINYMLSKQGGKAMVLASNNIGSTKTYAFASSLCKPPCARTCRSLFATRYSHSHPVIPSD